MQTLLLVSLSWPLLPMLLACVSDSLQLHQVIDHPQVADAVVYLAHGGRWVCLQSAAEEMHVAVADSTNLLVVMLVVHPFVSLDVTNPGRVQV